MRSVNWTFRMKIRSIRCMRTQRGFLQSMDINNTKYPIMQKTDMHVGIISVTGNVQNILAWGWEHLLFMGKTVFQYERYAGISGISGNTERIRKDVLKLSLKDQIEEFMYLGLRMTEGISEIDFEQNFGQKLENIYGSVLQKYKETGFLEKTGTNWRFTRKGIHVSNHILAELLLDEE